MLDVEDPPPLSLRRQIAIYEGARALIGAITPHFDEVAKVNPSPTLISFLSFQDSSLLTGREASLSRWVILSVLITTAMAS